MPFKIQKPPSGLIQFLRMVTGGRAPDALSEQVVPTIEMQEFYASDRFEIVSGVTSVAIGGVNTFVDVEVPSSERWRVHGIGAQLDSWSVTGETAICQPFINIARSQAFWSPIERPFGIPIADTGQAFSVGASVGPFILPPGALVRAINYTDTTGTADLLVVALIERIGA